MGSIPAANPAPFRKPHGARPALIVAASLLLAAMAVIVILAFTWPQSPEPARETRWIAVGAMEELTVNEPVLVQKHRLYLVKLESGNVIAFSRRSTHLGCSVDWRPDFVFGGITGVFRDPCSGSVWNSFAGRLFGPAPRNMDTYPVMITRGQVLVDTATRVCGFGYEIENPPLFCTPPTEYKDQPPLP